uniref:Putative ovule protein n=1 Tax=Solanum chacoense TaxID=4108 RepID=A0A0V0HJE4_SOLCH
MVSEFVVIALCKFTSNFTKVNIVTIIYHCESCPPATVRSHYYLHEFCAKFSTTTMSRILRRANPDHPSPYRSHHTSLAV